MLAGARLAHVFIHCKNPVAPAGMFILGSPQPSLLIPGGSPGPWLITSWIDSLFSSKSPIRHSPKAMVLLVPSVTSRTPLAETPLLARSLPPNMKMPLGAEEPDAPTQCRLEPTEAK